jgi:ribosomal protein S18 acetylase RimI-like enzyme
MNREDEVQIVELTKEEHYLREIGSKYSSSHYYGVAIHRASGSWNVEMILKAFDVALEKYYRGRLFEDHVQEPRAFAAVQGTRQVGWIELGYDKWNNRMRVWEFLVEEPFRRRGIGTLLMNHAVKIAKQKGVRMLVLETQTNNLDAINFYLQFGFHLVGLDVTAYSNDDIGRKEVRLELGLEL